MIAHRASTESNDDVSCSCIHTLCYGCICVLAWRWSDECLLLWLGRMVQCKLAYRRYHRHDKQVDISTSYWSWTIGVQRNHNHCSRAREESKAQAYPTHHSQLFHSSTRSPLPSIDSIPSMRCDALIGGDTNYKLPITFCVCI
jgi:hypothetical protein